MAAYAGKNRAIIDKMVNQTRVAKSNAQQKSAGAQFFKDKLIESQEASRAKQLAQ